MEKALDILKYIRNNDYIMDFLDKAYIKEAIKELEEAMKPKTCELYKEDEEDWRGQCGCIWGFNGENPIKAEAYFCPQCGGKIIEIDIGDNK